MPKIYRYEQGILDIEVVVEGEDYTSTISSAGYPTTLTEHTSCWSGDGEPIKGAYVPAESHLLTLEMVTTDFKGWLTQQIEEVVEAEVPLDVVVEEVAEVVDFILQFGDRFHLVQKSLDGQTLRLVEERDA